MSSDTREDQERHHQRRSTRRKKNTLIGSGDYVLDLDKEILALELTTRVAGTQRNPTLSTPIGATIASAYPSTSSYTSIGNESEDIAVKMEEGVPKKRKRGRPRKHPVIVDTVPMVKRPRGRPRGSGKHQRAAASVNLTPHDGRIHGAAISASGGEEPGTVSDGIPGTIPQVGEHWRAPETAVPLQTPAVSTGDVHATPDCSESTPISHPKGLHGYRTPKQSQRQESQGLPHSGMGLRSSSGKNRRKGSLPTKTEL